MSTKLFLGGVSQVLMKVSDQEGMPPWWHPPPQLRNANLTFVAVTRTRGQSKSWFGKKFEPCMAKSPREGVGIIFMLLKNDTFDLKKMLIMSLINMLMYYLS